MSQDVNDDDDISSPGLAKAVRTMDLLGYVYESEKGERHQDSPPVRTAAVYWKTRNAVKKSRQLNLSRRFG